MLSARLPVTSGEGWHRPFTGSKSGHKCNAACRAITCVSAKTDGVTAGHRSVKAKGIVEIQADRRMYLVGGVARLQDVVT